MSEASETPSDGSEILSQLDSGTVSGISSPSISLSLERSLALRSEFHTFSGASSISPQKWLAMHLL